MQFVLWGRRLSPWCEGEDEGDDREVAGTVILNSLLHVVLLKGERVRLACRPRVLAEATRRSVGCRIRDSLDVPFEAPGFLRVRLRRGWSFQAQAG